MIDGRQLVRTLEQELEATQQRCAQIERAIAINREIFGITGDVDDDSDVETPAPRRARKPAKRRYTRRKKAAKKADGRTDGAKIAPSGGRFDGPATDTADARVLTFVQKHPASRLGEIAEALALKSWTLRPALDRLLAAKRIIIAGSGRGQRVSAKEGL